MTQQITSGRMKLAEFARNTHVAVAPQGATLSDALEPVFWAHVANGIRPWDRIELRAEDDSWYADLIVFKTTRLEVFARVLNAIDRNGDSLSNHHAALSAPSPEREKLPAGYIVDYGGPVHKYRVIRGADSEVLTYGLSEDEAIEWAIEHAGAGKKKPVASNTAEPPEDRAAVVIPDDWKDLSWQDKRSLASKLTDDPVRNGADADAAIELEIERRKAA